MVKQSDYQLSNRVADYIMSYFSGLEYRSRYNDSLRAGRSGDRMPIPVAERSKARVCGRSLAGVAGSNPAGGMDVCVVCVLQSKRQKAKPGQSGQRSNTDKVKKKCRRRCDFSHPSTVAVGPPSLLYNGYPVFLPAVRRPECAVNDPPPSSAEVKERVELYFSFFVSSQPVLGQHYVFTFTVLFQHFLYTLRHSACFVYTGLAFYTDTSCDSRSK